MGRGFCYNEINYYIDITYAKTHLSKAQAVAQQLVKTIKHNVSYE